MSHFETRVLAQNPAPDTKSYRAAIAAIIRDIQHRARETDQQTADRLGVSVGTIRNARDEKADLSGLTLAKIGSLYGNEALAPFAALSARECDVCENVIPSMAAAMSALALAKGPKERFDALPAIKECVEALHSLVLSTERERLRVVA